MELRENFPIGARVRIDDKVDAVVTAAVTTAVQVEHDGKVEIIDNLARLEVISRPFELMMIFKKTDEDVLAAVCNMIVNDGGNIEKTETWGKKCLAFAINGYNEGMYYLITFHSLDNTVRKLCTYCKKNDNILRYMVIRKGA